MDERNASLSQNLKALPSGAWVLFLGSFLNKFGSFVLPFLAIYMTRIGFTSGQAGFAIGAYGVGTLAACLVGGWLADNFGRRRTIMLSMFSVAVVMVCLAHVTSFEGIVLFSCLAGLTGELYRPASSALLADLVPSGLRVTAYAGYRMALNAGFAFGPATAGFLAARDFHWLFYGDALTSVLFGIVAIFALPADGARRAVPKNAPGTWEVVVSDRALRQVLVSSLLVGLVFVQVFSSMSLEITKAGFAASTYGLIISLNGALVVLFELPLTTITKHWVARRAMAIGYVLIGLGFASNAFARTIPLLVLTTVLFTLGEIIAMPVSTAYVSNLAPEDKRGLYMGVYGLTWSLAFVAGPTAGLWLFSTSSLLLWSLCGVFGIAAAVLILRSIESGANISAAYTRPFRPASVLRWLKMGGV